MEWMLNLLTGTRAFFTASDVSGSCVCRKWRDHTKRASSEHSETRTTGCSWQPSKLETFQTLTVEVEDENIRHDIESCEIKNAYPDLPKASEWNRHKEFVKKRSNYIKEQDRIAYEDLQSEYNIKFKPPNCKL